MSRNGSNVPGISRNSGTADDCKYRKSNGYDGQQVKEISQESNDCLAVPKDEKHEEFEGNTLPRITANKGRGMLMLS